MGGCGEEGRTAIPTGSDGKITKQYIWFPRITSRHRGRCLQTFPQLLCCGCSFFNHFYMGAIPMESLLGFKWTFRLKTIIDHTWRSTQKDVDRHQSLPTGQCQEFVFPEFFKPSMQQVRSEMSFTSNRSRRCTYIRRAHIFLAPEA